MVASLGTAGAAERSEVPEVVGVPLRFGLFGGWHATSGDLDVLGERYEGNEPEPGPAFGLRVGWRPSASWGLDVTLGAIPAGPEWLLPIVGELRWRPFEGEVLTPTFGLGAGLYTGVGAGGDVDLLMSGAVGGELALGRDVVVRLELGLWASDAVAGTMAVSPVVTIGVDVLAWRERRSHAPEVERPPEPRPAPKGCPRGADPARCGDADADGIIDAFDRCPVDAGAIEGCADADGDGVPGPWDACPTRAGARIDWGCPR
ncbi:MAG: hypothetical protein IT385_28270 [Deltaproteobacteria bacterium]|nr:hypothetical protein [Deltaproteobacteria bacterium]